MNVEKTYQKAGEAIDRLSPGIEGLKGEIPQLLDQAKTLNQERVKVSLVVGDRKRRKYIIGLRKLNQKWTGIKFLLWVLQNRPKSSIRFEINPRDITAASLHDATNEFTLQRIRSFDSFLASSIDALKTNPEELRLLGSMQICIKNPTTEKLGEFKERMEAEWGHALATEANLLGVKREASNFIHGQDKVMAFFGAKRNILIQARNFIRSSRVRYSELNPLTRGIASFTARLQQPDIQESELSQRIENSMLVKKLINYQAAYQYVYHLQLMVWRGRQQRDWAEFEEFYKNLPKEETQLHKFGDMETAQRLITEEKIYHEFPDEWLKLLREIQQEKKSSQSIERAMHDGIAALAALIEQRLSELNSEFSQKIRQLTEPLNEEISKRLSSYAGVPEKVIKAIELRESVLLKEMDSFRKEFLKEETILFNLLQESADHYEVMPREQIKNAAPFIGQATERRSQFLDFANAHLKRAAGKDEMGMVNPFNMAMFATSRLEEIEHRLDQISVQTAPHLVSLPETVEKWESLLREFAARSRALLEKAAKNGFPITLNQSSNIPKGNINMAA